MTILALAAHPNKGSLLCALFKEACNGAREQGATVEEVYLYEKDIPHFNFNEGSQDTDVLKQKIKEANGYIVAFPNWWGNMPGIMRDMIDFVSDELVNSNGKSMPKPKLKGKKAMVIITHGAPMILQKMFMGNLPYRNIAYVLKEAGVRVTKKFLLGGIHSGMSDRKTKELLILANTVGRKFIAGVK